MADVTLKGTLFDAAGRPVPGSVIVGRFGYPRHVAAGTPPAVTLFGAEPGTGWWWLDGIVDRGA